MPAPIPDALAPSDPPRAPVVLIVDDERDNVRLLERQLVREGYEVRSAGDGVTALAELAREDVDLVLVDLWLPDASGIDLIHTIRARPGDEYLPVIMITAAIEQEREIEALEAGADDFVTKPYNPVLLRSRVRSMLRLKRAHDRLRELAVTDALTGLANRRRLLERLEEELERARRYGHPLSVLMGDLDRFKRVNDTYGHQTGDEVLRRLAHEMRAAIRATDLAGRWGGEEFLLVLPDTGIDEAAILAERLLGRVRRAAWPVAPEYGPITLSLGAAVFRTEPLDTSATLISRADDCLYRAKDQGRNRLVTEREQPAAPPPAG